MDTTIIAALSSTKNAQQDRDPEMTSTKKGNRWYFGMKVHLRTYRCGTAHSLNTTTAKEADHTQLPRLLRGKESVVHWDRGYFSGEANARLRKRGLRARIQRRAASGPPLTAAERKRNRRWARVRWPWSSTPSWSSSGCGASRRSATGSLQEHGTGVRVGGARQPLSALAPPVSAGGRNPSTERPKR